MAINPLPPFNPTLVRGLYPEVSTTGALADQGDILLTGASAAFANNPQFVGQVTLEEVHHDEMEIVDHPIQQGANITDHAFKRPAELTLHIGWAGANLVQYGFLATTANGQTYLAQLAAIYSQLLLGQQAAVLYTVITGKRQYTQMLIKSMITQSDKDNENVLSVTLHMKQIFIAQVQVNAVASPQGAQFNPQSTYPVQSNGRATLAPAAAFDNTVLLSWAGLS